MKKIFLILAVIMSMPHIFAQNTSGQTSKEQTESDAFYIKLLNVKPTKKAKKQAKKLKKEGWMVPAGEKSIEEQLMQCLLYRKELIKTENGEITNRFIMGFGAQSAKNYNTSYAVACANAQTELAGMLNTEIVAVIEMGLENVQYSSVDAATMNRFSAKSQHVVDVTLKNSKPVLVIYRRLQNNDFEVQVQLAFDNQELAARLKCNMQKTLEGEEDSLDSVVDEVFGHEP